MPLTIQLLGRPGITRDSGEVYAFRSRKSWAVLAYLILGERPVISATAPVEGFVGFAIGRSIWWDALKGFLAEELEREAAAEQIAENYLRFIGVYEEQEQGGRAAVA